MKRKMGRLIGLSGFCVLGLFTFPRWTWSADGSDCIGCLSQHAFIFTPPERTARIDPVWAAFWIGGIGLTATVSFARTLIHARDEEAAQYWRGLWAVAPENAETLLRAARPPAATSDQLLRPARAHSQNEPSNTLLLASVNGTMAEKVTPDTDDQLLPVTPEEGPQ
jgi:hypothetical protein